MQLSVGPMDALLRYSLFQIDAYGDDLAGYVYVKDLIHYHVAFQVTFFDWLFLVSLRVMILKSIVVYGC